MTKYTSSDLLPLSGIQHFIFCRRQWALIHVERQWQENVLTAEGRIMHERADQPFLTEARPGKVVSRALPVASYTLGLSGICDVVEFIESAGGIHLPKREGLYLPVPVEYKRGKEKSDRSDEAQLCAQAICLEEMLAVDIPTGYLFYGKTKHRVEVDLNEDLCGLVRSISDEMHAYFRRGYTPRVKKTKACRSCSLADLCLPALEEKTVAASKYIQQQIKNA
jgi:CRISPR-associated exonuclease Cas4